MYSKVYTCVLQGLEANKIEVETDLARGIPMLNIVGLPDAAIRESKERVRTAIKNTEFEFPLNRITINLAPAAIKKEGSQLDLAIAVGILMADAEIRESDFKEYIFIGELSLEGKVNGVQGALPMVISMRKQGIKKFIVPYDNREECSIINDIDIIPVKNLKEVVDYLNGEIDIEPYKPEESFIYNNVKTNLDFSDIKGQEGLKRALEIAAAGNHNILIIGPPGSGKTMAARRLPSIMPDLTFEEAVEITKIYSISGLLDNSGLIKERPFRSPHHTSSNVALIGGGRVPKPGEVSLAHHGVLFLDELPEFQRNVLEVLRQPIEDSEVTISRVNASLKYPSKFLFVASMNPCPCGYYGDEDHNCTCTSSQIDKYLGKISSPLLDRIDIHIEVKPVKFKELSSQHQVESSEVIKGRVNRARQIQLERYKNDNILSNSELSPKKIKDYLNMSESASKIIEAAFKKYGFSARSYNKILKLSRTIADLDESIKVQDNHILEAIQYRTLDQKYWR